MLTLDLTDVLLINGNAYDILNPQLTEQDES